MTSESFQIKRDLEAVTVGLYLALCASNAKKAKQVTELTDSIATRLSPEKLAICKQLALERYKKHLNDINDPLTDAKLQHSTN